MIPGSFFRDHRAELSGGERERGSGMDVNRQKEEFSHAYVRAVASAAGFAVARPEVDDDSVDLILAAAGGGGTFRSPRIELQLKCTAGGNGSAEDLSFPLKIKNYEDLRAPNVLVPRLLVLVCVPEKPEDWLSQTQEQLVLRRCGYWLSLRGAPETDNVAAVTVRLPRAQVFSIDALRALMARVAEGAAL